MNGSIPPTFRRSPGRDLSTSRESVYDVRRPRGCTRCYAVQYSFGGSPTAPPKASRPPCERPSPVPPISSVREEKAKATLSQISSLNFRIPGSTQSRLPTLVDSKFSSEFCFPKYLIVEK